MRIYFDNCSIQRPFDSKTQIRIRIEAEAILSIIELIEEGKLKLVTSSVVEYELKKTPDLERISFGLKVISLHSERMIISDKIIKKAKEFEKQNIKAIDALHLAIADVGTIDYLCTCDDRFNRNGKKIKGLKTKIVSPIEFIEEYENDYNDK